MSADGEGEELDIYSLSPAAPAGAHFAGLDPPSSYDVGPAYDGEIELLVAESASGELPKADRRRPIPPPPPVSLVTVEDARLLSSIGWDRELDAFYVGLLQFERDTKADGIAYKAENFRIVFQLFEGPVERDDLRMLGIIVKSLTVTAEKFREAKVEFERERGLAPGEERLVLQDPAGNWLRISSSRIVM